MATRRSQRLSALLAKANPRAAFHPAHPSPSPSPGPAPAPDLTSMSDLLLTGQPILAAMATVEPGPAAPATPSAITVASAAGSARRRVRTAAAADIPAAAATGVQGVQLPVLRCVADLEAAVAHLRAKDPRLVPLIDAHGLPYSLLAAHAGPGPGPGPDANTSPVPTEATPTQLDAGGPTSATLWPIPAGAGAAGGPGVSVSSGDGAGGWGSGAQRSVFAALARCVVYQQLATNAATAIWGRVLAVCKVSGSDRLAPRHVMAAPPVQLRAAGLSGRKVEYLTGLAEAFAARDGWDERLSASTDVSLLVSELTPLRGVGTWTVHMLAISQLGLPDVLPTGDLAVLRGLQLIHGLPQPPQPEEAEALTEAWRPYRSVGAWYMWRIPPPPRVRSIGSKKGAKKTAGAAAAGRAASAGDEVLPAAADRVLAGAKRKGSGRGVGSGRGGARRAREEEQETELED